MATIEQPKTNGATGAKSKVFRNFIDGEWVESASGQTFENLNPADTREVVGIFQRSGRRRSMPPWLPPAKHSTSGG